MIKSDSTHTQNMPTSTPTNHGHWAMHLGHPGTPPGYSSFTAPAAHLLACIYCAVALLYCTIVLYSPRDCAPILHHCASSCIYCVMGSGLVPAPLFMMLTYASLALDLLPPSPTLRCWGGCLRVGFVCVGCAVGVRFCPPSGTPGLGPAWSSLGGSTSLPSGGHCRSTDIDYCYLLLSSTLIEAQDTIRISRKNFQNLQPPMGLFCCLPTLLTCPQILELRLNPLYLETTLQNHRLFELLQDRFDGSRGNNILRLQARFPPTRTSSGTALSATVDRACLGPLVMVL
jgi:hypothetical protein